MDLASMSKIPEIIKKHEAKLLEDWLKELKLGSDRRSILGEMELKEECQEFLNLFIHAVREANFSDIKNSEWSNLKGMVESVSRTRSLKGFSPSETANFIFSFKRPLFSRLRQELEENKELVEEIWRASSLLDELGLFTTEVHQKAREEVIIRQQQELLELSTPVIKLWEGILALPLIGTLDSARTQIIMESLLQRIVETESNIAIIDITGVPAVDTLTAQHLLKTVSAARLMGADCIISGIRPQIAQTIVYLGIDLSEVITRANLADALILALQRTGNKIIPNEKQI
jgi:rsbT co-antagonist protein RsbR